MKTPSTQRNRPAFLRDQSGATLVEFAIVSSLLFGLLFGIVEFGLAFRDRLTVADATQSAARVGASLGDSAGSDYAILEDVEESVANLPREGADTVRFVDIFSARDDGTPASACPGDACNRYKYTPGVTPTCNWTPCPDPTLGPPVYGGTWTPDMRDVALPDLGVLGVQVTYAHAWVTGGLIPLPLVTCDATPGSRCWADTALMRFEPQVFEP